MKSNNDRFHTNLMIKINNKNNRHAKLDKIRNYHENFKNPNESPYKL